MSSAIRRRNWRNPWVKSRSHIANLLRLEGLPESIKRQIDHGSLSMGHARALLNAKNPEALAAQIMETGLSVRQAEELARTESLQSRAKKSATPKTGKSEKNEDVAQLEQMLADSLGLNVSITTHNAKRARWSSLTNRSPNSIASCNG